MPGGGHRWKTLVSRKGVELDIEFPPVAHRPWKSRRTRFPHSHSADLFVLDQDKQHGARPSGARRIN